MGNFVGRRGPVACGRARAVLHGVRVEVAAGLADRRAFAVVRGQAVVDRIRVRGDSSGGGGRLDDVGEAEVGEVADGLRHVRAH